MKQQKRLRTKGSHTDNDDNIQLKRTYINTPTMFCLLLTIAAMAYQNYDNIRNTFYGNQTRQDQKINSTIDSETNVYDSAIVLELNKGDALYKQRKYQQCVAFFENLSKKHSSSPRAVYGQAMCLDKLAEEKKSNEILKKAIATFGLVAKQPNVPLNLLRLTLLTQARKCLFLGENNKAVSILFDLSKEFQDDFEIMRELGIAYNSNGQKAEARLKFEQVLQVLPSDGLALVHYGYILKLEEKYEECIPYLMDGILSEVPGTDTYHFYFHLADAYVKTDQTLKAKQIHKEMVKKGFISSVEQRPRFNAATKLRAQPWWTIQESGYKKEIKLLEKHWKTIRDEAQAIYNESIDAFPHERGFLTQSGDWRQFKLYKQGKKVDKNCQMTPKTCRLLEKIPDATSNQRGQIKYSVMQPGTHVWPHTGPTNCRLRVHLGLNIPENVFIRVGTVIRTWQDGKALIIDDSFEHEVWHNGTIPRLILIVDFWHPDVPQWERQTLKPV